MGTLPGVHFMFREDRFGVHSMFRVDRSWMFLHRVPFHVLWGLFLDVSSSCTLHVLFGFFFVVHHFRYNAFGLRRGDIGVCVGFVGICLPSEFGFPD